MAILVQSLDIILSGHSIVAGLLKAAYWLNPEFLTFLVSQYVPDINN